MQKNSQDEQNNQDSQEGRQKAELKRREAWLDDLPAPPHFKNQMAVLSLMMEACLEMAIQLDRPTPGRTDCLGMTPSLKVEVGIAMFNKLVIGIAQPPPSQIAVPARGPIDLRTIPPEGFLKI